MGVAGSTRLLAAMLVLLLVGCSERDGTDASDGNDPIDADASVSMTYYVRGIVIELPSERGDLVIRHESIPEFMSIKGEIVGMNSMQMPFPLGADASLEGIAVGDKVQFVLEVDWDPSYFIVEISTLAPETELDFSKDRPMLQVDPGG